MALWYSIAGITFFFVCLVVFLRFKPAAKKQVVANLAEVAPRPSKIGARLSELWNYYHLSEWMLLCIASAIAAAMFREFLTPENQNEYRNLVLIALGILLIILLAIRAPWEKSSLRKGLMFLLFTGIVWQGAQFIGLTPTNIGKTTIREKAQKLWGYAQNAKPKFASHKKPFSAFPMRLRELEIGESAQVQFELKARSPSEWFMLEERVGSRLHRRKWKVEALDCALENCMVMIKELRDGQLVRAAFRDTGGKQLWGGDHDSVAIKISFVAREPTRLMVTLTRKS